MRSPIDRPNTGSNAEIDSGRRAINNAIPVTRPTEPTIHASTGPRSILPTIQCDRAAMFRSPINTECSEIGECRTRVEMMITPTAKNAGNTRPTALSSVKRPRPRSHSVPATSTTPPNVAPTISHGEVGESDHNAATAMPGSTAWAIASLIIACRRSTSTVPGSAQVTATTAANKATEIAKLMRVPLPSHHYAEEPLPGTHPRKR